MVREILAIDYEEAESFWKRLDTGAKMLYSGLAKKGLEMLSKNVSLVFLNISPPDIDGMEVLSIIKKEYPSTAVIIIACCESEDRCRCMEAFRKGAWDFIKKPLKAGEILHKIKVVLNSNDVPQILPVSAEPVSAESYPDIPSHLVTGVLKVRDYLDQNYSESLTLSAACKMARLSKTYFCRFFKSITGQSLRSYHHFIKIQIAQELLQDRRLSITDVAIRLGFNDSNYFSTVYKKITGVSPRCSKAASKNYDVIKETEKSKEALGSRF